MDYTKNREGLQGKRRDLLPFSWYRAGKQGAALPYRRGSQGYDTAFQPQYDVCSLGESVVMGDHDYASVFPMGTVLENPGDLPGGVCVQIASGLIREDDRRLGGQSPGDGHPLLLSPGKGGDPPPGLLWRQPQLF